MKKQNTCLVFITDMFGSDMGFFRPVPGNRDNVRMTSLPDGSISGEDVKDEGEVQSAGDEI